MISGLSVNKAQKTQTVLHVADGLSGASAALGERLEELAVEEVRVPDLYRGLARFCKLAVDLKAAFVCVDGTGDELFEFVQLAHNAHPDVPLFVYGEHLDAGLLDSLVAAGVAGEADVQSLAHITQDVSAPTSGSGSFAEDSSCSAVDDDAASDADHDDGSSATQTPRFPWQDYADRPSRTGPSTRDVKADEPPSPGSDEGESPGASAHRQSHGTDDLSHIPLLTEEELRMLIYDDDDSPDPSATDH